MNLFGPQKKQINKRKNIILQCKLIKIKIITFIYTINVLLFVLTIKWLLLISSRSGAYVRQRCCCAFFLTINPLRTANILMQGLYFLSTYIHMYIHSKFKNVFTIITISYLWRCISWWLVLSNGRKNWIYSNIAKVLNALQHRVADREIEAEGGSCHQLENI